MRKIFGTYGLIQHYKWVLTNKIHCFHHGHPKYARWDINSWFLDNITQLLDAMIENEYLSTPMVYNEETGDCAPDENWRDKLILMNYGFKRYKAVCEDMVGYEEMRKSYGLSNRFEFVDDGEYRRLVTAWDENRELYEEFQDAWLKEEVKAKEALDRSLKMFSEYFLDLWD